MSESKFCNTAELWTNQKTTPVLFPPNTSQICDNLQEKSWIMPHAPYATYWSLCVYVCVCATAHVHDGFFTTVCTDEIFSSQRIYSRPINDCNTFASLPPQGYCYGLAPNVLEGRAGHYASEEEGSAARIALVHRGEINLLLSFWLGPDQGTLSHALWLWLVLYNLKWKQEKCWCFTYHHALSGPKSF